MKPWIVLTGYRGSGKTTLGRKLASDLSLPFYDQDSLIQKESSRSIQELFNLYGEDYFRDLETRVLFNLPKTPLVLATGGGIVERKENLKYLKANSTVFYLNLCPETLFERRKGKEHDPGRPVLENQEDLKMEIQTIFKRREPFYIQSADYMVKEGNIHSMLQELKDNIKHLGGFHGVQ